MSFVKLDCGMLDSTIWLDREAREIFITSLLMARPYEVRHALRQIEVRTLNETGFEVPPGWYGFVSAAGIGIVSRAGMEVEAGLAALERLGAPEMESRSPEYEGRRVVRVSGGYVVLNFMKYREKDHTGAERSKRWRQKQKKRPQRQVRAASDGRSARYVKAYENGDDKGADNIASEGLQ